MLVSTRLGAWEALVGVPAFEDATRDVACGPGQARGQGAAPRAEQRITAGSRQILYPTPPAPGHAAALLQLAVAVDIRPSNWRDYGAA